MIFISYASCSFPKFFSPHLNISKKLVVVLFLFLSKNTLHGEVFHYTVPDGKNVFFIYTYGAKKDGYSSAIREAVAGKNANVIGEYGCFGFNTFGPFKLIGGIAKNHLDNDEIQEAVAFYNNLHK